jgi:hypothetical protein
MNRISELQCTVGRAIYMRHAQSLFVTKALHPTGGNAGFLASKLDELERFVLYALTDVVPAVPMLSPDTDGTVQSKYNFSGSERYFTSIPNFVEIVRSLSSHYEYNECVKVFRYCCESLNLLGSKPLHLDYSAPGENQPNLNFINVTGEVFNALVQRIRIEWNQQALGEKYRSRCREAEMKGKEYRGYEVALFEHNTKLIVVKVEFLYAKEFINQIVIDDAVVDMNRLMGNKRNNSIFKPMKGYVAKVGWDIDKGLYWHVIFFLEFVDADDTCHADFGEIVGEYWSKQITKGRGAYRNASSVRKIFDEVVFLGTRTINAEDVAVRQNLRDAITFLCKTNQCLRPKGSAGMRLIRKGQDPKTPSIKKKRSPPAARPKTKAKPQSKVESSTNSDDL